MKLNITYHTWLINAFLYSNISVYCEPNIYVYILMVYPVPIIFSRYIGTVHTVLHGTAYAYGSFLPITVHILLHSIAEIHPCHFIFIKKMFLSTFSGGISFLRKRIG